MSTPSCNFVTKDHWCATATEAGAAKWRQNQGAEKGNDSGQFRKRATTKDTS